MNKNLIAIRSGVYGTVGNEMERLPKIGITNLEVELPAQEAVADVMAQLQQNGLTATTLAVDFPIQDDGIFEYMKGAVDIACRMGVNRFFASFHSNELPLDQVYQRMHQIGDIMAAGNIVLGMETHPDLCHNADLAIQTLATINHPNIRLNYDMANIYYYNRDINTTADGVEQAKKVAPYVSSVHVKDIPGGYEEWEFQVLGEGIVDFAGNFKALNDAGFTGPFTIELEGFDREEYGVDGVDRIITQSLQHLKNLGLA